MANAPKKNKRAALISGVSIVVLIGVIFIMTSLNKEDPQPEDKPTINPIHSPISIDIKTPETSGSEIKELESAPPSSNPTTPPVIVPEIKEQPAVNDTPILQPEAKKENIEVPIVAPQKTTKPTEPPKPKPKPSDKKQDSSTPPTYDEKETEPAKKEATEPKAGDKDNTGKVFVPGFGWIKDSGENKGTKSDSDGDWDKQVGKMD